MKLRNKQSGEIKEFVLFDGKEMQAGLTLENLAQEWEDAPEEPKEYWFIEWNGEVCRSDIHDERTGRMKQIGNYFETREEAEQAVRKLKAWKLLKDFGCGFMLDDHCAVKFVGTDARKITSAEEHRLLSDAYKLLFGGEE